MTGTSYGTAAARERSGWFFGLTGPQLTLLVIAAAPAWLALALGAWLSLLLWVPLWLLAAGLVCVPVRGWSAAQWCGVLLRYLLGSAAGWTHWQSKPAAGDLDDLGEADLPGVLAGIQIHDGPPMPGALTRVAVIQNHATRTWAATARIDHPGLALSSPEERDQMGSGLAELCEHASASEMVDLIAICVRTMPEDGAARADWVTRHRHPDAPNLATEVNQALEQQLLPASVRREVFVTVVVGENRIGRDARRSGGGVAGRARALYPVLAETESRLRGGLGCTGVTWLDSAALAIAVRTGFEPGDAPALAAASIAAQTQPDIAPGIPMGAAGPTHARTAMRSYRHGEWDSVTATLLLPPQGALIGALAPILVPSVVGERRSLTVFYRPVSRRSAHRHTGREEMSAAMAAELRRRAGVLERASQRRAAQQVAENDTKLAHGRALVRVNAAVSITVPAGWASTTEFARRLDSSVRLSGFTPLALDGAHDTAFAAATIPLGTGLPSSRRRR